MVLTKCLGTVFHNELKYDGDLSMLYMHRSHDPF